MSLYDELVFTMVETGNGMFLKRIQERSNLSPEEFAQKLGWSLADYEDFLNGPSGDVYRASRAMADLHEKFPPDELALLLPVSPTENGRGADRKTLGQSPGGLPVDRLTRIQKLITDVINAAPSLDVPEDGDTGD